MDYGPGKDDMWGHLLLQGHCTLPASVALPPPLSSWLCSLFQAVDPMTFVHPLPQPMLLTRAGELNGTTITHIVLSPTLSPQPPICVDSVLCSSSCFL